MSIAIGVAVALLEFMIVFAGYEHGVSTERNHQQLVIANMISEHQAEEARLQDIIRENEHRAAERMVAIDQHYQESLQNAQQDIDKLRADVHAGTIKLRKHFTCPALPNTQGTAAATGTGGSDAGEEGGLSNEDADVLISIAKEADDVVRQLQACQAIVRSDRASH
jgi:prophage endopeptidase